MTKNELKSVIMECLEDAGIDSVAEEMSFEEEFELNQFMLECFIAEAYDDAWGEDYSYLFYEGANLDSRAIFKEMKSAYKAEIKSLKGNLARKDKDAAKKNVVNITDILTKAEKEINNIDSTVGSAYIATLTSWTVDFGHNMGTALSVFIPIYGVIRAFKDGVDKVNAKASQIKNSDNTDAQWNSYKAEILKVIARYKSEVKALNKKIDKLDD